METINPDALRRTVLRHVHDQMMKLAAIVRDRPAAFKDDEGFRQIVKDVRLCIRGPADPAWGSRTFGPWSNRKPHLTEFERKVSGHLRRAEQQLEDWERFPHAACPEHVEDLLADIESFDSGSEREVETTSHSEDFTSVNWHGQRFTFTKGNQAQSVYQHTACYSN